MPKYKIYLKVTEIKTEEVYITAGSRAEAQSLAEDRYHRSNEYGNGCASYTDVGSVEEYNEGFENTEDDILL